MNSGAPTGRGPAAPTPSRRPDRPGYTAQTWLVAYDIRDKRRLSRVHRLLAKKGLPCQYSVFMVEANAASLAGLKATLAKLIDSSQDDVRFYHLTANARLWTIGTQFRFDGSFFTTAALTAMLRHSALPVEDT